MNISSLDYKKNFAINFSETEPIEMDFFNGI